MDYQPQKQTHVNETLTIEVDKEQKPNILSKENQTKKIYIQSILTAEH